MGQQKTERQLDYLQIWMGVIANLGSIGPGMSLGFSAIALPQLTSSSNSFQLDSDQASWFAGLAAIAMPVGCLLSGPLLDRFGRKIALLLVNVPCLIGWLLIATVGDSGAGVIEQLYVGRILTGLSTGMTSVPATIYLAEISSHTEMRSMLVTWTSIAIAAGILIVYILGALFQHSWRLIAFICATVPVVSFLLTTFILPESPVWLVSKGRNESAIQSLKVLRGQEKQQKTCTLIEEEMNQITLTHENSVRSQPEQTFWNNVTYMLEPEAWKPLIIMNTYFFFQQMSGVFVVIFYAVDVVEDAGVTINSYLATVLIGLMRFIVTIVVSLISKRFGRRPPSIISGTGMTICMCILALFLYLIHIGRISGEAAQSLSWIPVTVLLLYIFMSTLGFLTIPWAMMGEVFPARIRGIASGCTTCLAYIFSFFIVKGYPQMLELMGKHGVFFFYGAMTCLGTVFVIVFLPETQGKSFQEISEHFQSKSKKYKTHSSENGFEEKGIPLLDRASENNSSIITPMNSKHNTKI